MVTADSYDYIVLGAGSAGCVLANRLSADPARRVLLVEAGPGDRNPLLLLPVMAGRWFLQPYLNWNLPDRAAAGTRRAPDAVAAWQGARRFLDDQRHDLCAW